MTNDQPVDGAALGWQLSTAVILFHEAIGQRLGLNATDHKALVIIQRHGPLSARKLAELTGLTPGAVTGLVDRLERSGHVRRVPNPDDRRRVLISALPMDSRADLAPMFAELTERMTAVFQAYDERQRAAVIDYLHKTIEILRDQTRRISEMD